MRHICSLVIQYIYEKVFFFSWLCNYGAVTVPSMIYYSPIYIHCMIENFRKPLLGWLERGCNYTFRLKLWNLTSLASLDGFQVFWPKRVKLFVVLLLGLQWFFSSSLKRFSTCHIFKLQKWKLDTNLVEGSERNRDILPKSINMSENVTAFLREWLIASDRILPITYFQSCPSPQTHTHV